MRQDNQILTLCLRALLLTVLLAGLSACAGRPKPLQPTTPFNVTQVRVMADNVENLGFADHLENRLEASVGRATAEVGQTSSLLIVVQDRRREPSPVSFFGGRSESASLDLSLVDSKTGKVLRQQSLHSTVSRFDGDYADTMLVARLTDDIRSLLGLSGYTPYPVSGTKRDVVSPMGKPDRFDVDDEALRAADPLLNGTVTPTTVNLVVEPDPGSAIDLSKPLLGENADVAGPAPASPAPATTPEPVKVTLNPKPKAVELLTEAGGGAESSLDEPCIITLENDCSDPDSR